MDQDLNNRQNGILSSLLANSADTGRLYISDLQKLVDEFPQSGLLQAMLAHAEGGPQINRAATYFSPKALYKLINSSGDFADVMEEQLISRGHDLVAKPIIAEATNFYRPAEDQTEEVVEADEHTPAENYFSEEPEAEVAGVDEALLAGATEEDVAEDHQEETHEAEITEGITPVEQVAEQENYFSEEPVTDIIDPEESELANVVENDQSEVIAEQEETTQPVEETEVPVSAEIESEQAEVPALGHEDQLPVEEVTGQQENEQLPVAEETEQAIPVMEDTAPEHYFNEAQEPESQGKNDSPLITAEEEKQENTEDTPEIEEPFTVIDEITDPPLEQVIEEEKHEAPVFTIDEQEAITSADIDDEVFDEIVGIEDIRFSETPQHTEDAPLPLEIAESNGEPVEEIANTTAGNETKDRQLDMNDEAERLIVGNIAATDYFMFDRAFSEQRPNDEPVAEEHSLSAEIETKHPAELPPAAETQDVSKYHDEKMPYTFMWWLDKTRKEHAGMYQPYIEPGSQIAQQGADALQQQYYENIFHLNSVEELNRSTAQQTVEFDMERKEDVIIQRFIREEPQIKSPSNDKLDNENKAKKSAEDQDELVTETLARIYTDQMLYHKAINTYKKLVLKFPEKSRYFADQIEQLQRKIN